MGGFFASLGDAALGAVKDQIGVGDNPEMQAGQRNQQNLLTNIVGRYMRAKRQQTLGTPGANVPSNYDQNVPGINPAHLTDESNPMDPNRYEGDGMQGPPQSGEQIPNQNQWQSSPTPPPMMAGVAAGLAKGATMVTQPTIAKIGESGPEMVVPMNASAHNRVQPDVLEGHITAPKVPGVRYNRYKAFTDRAL